MLTVHLLLRLVSLFHGVAVVVHGTARGDVAHGAHSIVHIRHLLADDHHVLAAGLDDGHNAIGLFQNVCICLALVLQLEAQTGHAVSHRNNIALAADILDDNAGKAIVFTCHK